MHVENTINLTSFFLPRPFARTESVRITALIKMSVRTATTVTQTLNRYDGLAREAVETAQPRIFMQRHGEEIVSCM